MNSSVFVFTTSPGNIYLFKVMLQFTFYNSQVIHDELYTTVIFQRKLLKQDGDKIT